MAAMTDETGALSSLCWEMDTAASFMPSGPITHAGLGMFSAQSLGVGSGFYLTTTRRLAIRRPAPTIARWPASGTASRTVKASLAYAA